MKLVRRLDLGELRPAQYRDDGTLRADAHLTRCGVFPYLQPDGSIHYELRLPEEVHNPESLSSFSGVPVTNEHPPEMIDGDNARQYMVGAVQGDVVPDDDHVRGRLAVYDASTVARMRSGKNQVSLGYTCDLEERPGEHPVYGHYDAIQRNIRGNHVAIVDVARAGSTARVRLDAAERMLDGTTLASCTGRAKVHDMADEAQKSQGGEPSKKDPDPKDLASRNAAGETEAKPKDKAAPAPKAEEESPAARADKDPEDPEESDDDDDPDDDDEEGEDIGSDDDDDDEEDRDDAYSVSYGDDGELTAEARHKLATSSFAVPDREGLPIHDPEHTRAAMSRFNQFKFKDPEEKHAAFNRIKRRAKHFGISSEGFEKSHAPHLDRQDRNMLKSEKIKALEGQLAEARKDAADAKAAQAKAEGERDSAMRDLDAAKKARQDAAEANQKAIDEKVELVATARSLGAKVEAKMSAADIKRAVVKHVDGIDVPADKPEPYVDALYDGTLVRARKDAADTKAGADALAAARAATGNAQEVKNDADDLDEVMAARKARAKSAERWAQPWTPKTKQENK